MPLSGQRATRRGRPATPAAGAGGLRAWRLARGLTLPELAALLDVGSATVWRWETGRQRPPGRLLELALAELGRTLGSSVPSAP